MIEWTHWKNNRGTAVHGAERYEFDPASGKIAKIRAYYAAPADKSVTINELVRFNQGRSYPLKSKSR